jgi:hypothetical protein
MSLPMLADIQRPSSPTAGGSRKTACSELVFQFRQNRVSEELITNMQSSEAKRTESKLGRGTVGSKISPVSRSTISMRLWIEDSGRRRADGEI